MVSGQSLRILIADAHPTSRDGLNAAVSQCFDLEVCGEAGDAEQAIQLTHRLHPDVIVADCAARLRDALKLIAGIRIDETSPRLLLWSRTGGRIFIDRALQAGADGYLAKTEPTERVITAIRAIGAGRKYIPADLEAIRRAGRSQTRRHAQSLVDTLSDRELQVFQALGGGWDTRGIAERLGLSTKTVETYRVRIGKKLGTATHRQLFRYAVEWSLLVAAEGEMV